MNNNTLPLKIISAQNSEKARRPNNEDSVAFFEPSDPQERDSSGCVYIVADGVGGASIGERASRYAADKVLFEYLKHPASDPRDRLREVIVRVSREIFDYAEGNDIRMATTITVAVVRGEFLYAANVGDSRVYRIRGSDVEQITRDHNQVGELVRDGSMTEAQAQASRIRNKLTRSVGGQDEVQVDVFGPIVLKPDDKILLCSDGLTRYALKEDLARMTAQGSPQEIVKTLIHFAKRRGGADNVSAIVAVYEPTTAFEPAVTVEQRPVHDLDIRETIPAIPTKRRVRREPAWVFWFAGSVFSIGLIAVIVVISMIILKDYSDDALPVASATNTSLSPIALPSTALTATLKGPSASSVTPFSIPSLTTTLTPFPAPSYTPTIAPSFTITATPDVNLVSCAYTIKPFDNLSNVAGELGLGGNNYKNSICAPANLQLTPTPTQCDLRDRSKIQPGWVIVFPNVSLEICQAKGMVFTPSQ